MCGQTNTGHALSRSVHSPWWDPGSWMASLLNFVHVCLIQHFHLRIFLTLILRLLLLTVLVLGALLSGFLEVAL